MLCAATKHAVRTAHDDGLHAFLWPNHWHPVCQGKGRSTPLKDADWWGSWRGPLGAAAPPGISLGLHLLFPWRKQSASTDRLSQRSAKDQTAATISQGPTLNQVLWLWDTWDRLWRFVIFQLTIRIEEKLRHVRDEKGGNGFLTRSLHTWHWPKQTDASDRWQNRELTVQYWGAVEVSEGQVYY